MAIITDINEAWVELYDDKNFRDRRLTIKHPSDIPDMHKIATDDGKHGFNDKASSAKWQIPTGWKCVLHDDINYKDNTFELVGTGSVEENADLGSFSDKTSSARWLRT